MIKTRCPKCGSSNLDYNQDGLQYYDCKECGCCFNILNDKDKEKD